MFRQKLPKDWQYQNLCYLANLGYKAQRTKQFKGLAKKPHFFCKSCGRAASHSENVCSPQEI